MNEMDDQRFDDSIKNKLGEYEASSFEPTALASLHHQLGAAAAWPWYAQYRTELLVGSSLAISTLVILWSQWNMSNKTADLVNEKIVQLQTQQAQIDKLQGEISSLKNSPPDTIRIIEIREQPSSHYASLLYRIQLLEAKSNQANNGKNGTEIFPQTFQDGSSTPLKFGNNDEADPKPEWQQNTRVSPRITERESMLAQANDEAMITQSTSKNLSAKTLRDIEKHYQQGVGIRVGPMIELSKGFYETGKGRIGITWGGLADFIVSPSLSIETGLKYAHRIYEISDQNELDAQQLPGMDPSLGTLKTIDIDSWIFEIPLNLKYRYPVTVKTHWLAGVGYSSLIYGKQVFEYEYGMPGNPDVSISSGYETSYGQAYAGTLNFSLGISNQLKNKKILEMSLFYQLGLGKTGIEKNSINYLGVRGAYWFTVR